MMHAPTFDIVVMLDEKFQCSYAFSYAKNSLLLIKSVKCDDN